MNQDVRENAWYCGLSGLVMLGFAFLQPLSALYDHGPLYAGSFDVFRSTLLGGGTLLLVIAALSVANLGVAALMEAIVTSLSGTLMTACAICWTVYEGTIDVTNLLVLVFGLLMAQSGIRGLMAYRVIASRESVGAAPERTASTGWFGLKRGGPPVPAPPVAPEPTHPASLASSALPKAGEAPPEEGYLAALSKERDEPPGDRDA